MMNGTSTAGALDTYGLTVFTGGRGADRFRRAADIARRAEAVGFGAMWTGELYSRSATIPMAVLGSATERIRIGSNIAYGVGRALLIWAAEARDLDELTEGRLVLGLGNGTSGMMENWLGTSGEAPAVRMEELVSVLRKLWRLHEGPVHHEGRFYRLHLAPTADTPPPYREHLPIWTAGVGPRMVRAAGRVADGLVTHPMATAPYLDEAVRPELTRGAEEAARRRIAYAIAQYAASRVYDRLFAIHGWEAHQQRIRAAAKDGDPGRMAAAVPDEAVDAAIGIACTPADFPDQAARHAVHVDHLDLCGPPWGLPPEELEAATVAILTAMSPSSVSSGHPSASALTSRSERSTRS